MAQTAGPRFRVGGALEGVVLRRGEIEPDALGALDRRADPVGPIAPEGERSGGTDGRDRAHTGQARRRQEHRAAADGRAHQREPPAVDEVLGDTPAGHPDDVVLDSLKADLGDAAHERRAERVEGHAVGRVHHDRSPRREDGVPVAPLVEGERGDAGLEEVGHERCVAVAGGRVLVGEHREGETAPRRSGGVRQRALQDQSVRRRDGHLHRREAHANPSCLVSRRQS